ncbi:MAG: DUF4349 domain-containing protein [Thermoleophilaceae bacterium]|nr:DUF4349 domain-containing protein [Thermoleophilaceae bacterium]
MKSSDRRRAEQDRSDETLATVDAALDSGLADADADDERERQLGRLALTLRTGAPEPSAAFEAKLEQELGASFASKRADGAASASRGGRAPRRRGGRIGRLDRRALGAFAVALLALAVGGGLLATVSGRTGGEGISAGGGGAAPMIAPEEGGSSGPSLRSTPPDTAMPSDGDGFAPGEAERRIERTASLTLAASEERIDAVADGVVAVTDRHRGFVVTSSISSGEDQQPGGSFDLRVPVDELRATLSDLAALGTVRAQSQTGDDLTESVATTDDRLDGARAERRGLLRRLERADTDREARALRAQLDLVSGEIRGLRGELQALEERTDYARVSVMLTDEGADGGAGGAGSSTGEALDDALGTLLGALNLLVRGLGVAIPLVLVAGVTWLTFSTLRRRRREGALS